MAMDLAVRRWIVGIRKYLGYIGTRWAAGTVSNPHREAAQLMVIDLAVRRWIVGIRK
jgi:hypothetical protein